MSKLKATGNFGDLKSKVNVISNVKVILKKLKVREISSNVWRIEDLIFKISI